MSERASPFRRGFAALAMMAALGAAAAPGPGRVYAPNPIVASIGSQRSADFYRNAERYRWRGAGGKKPREGRGRSQPARKRHRARRRAWRCR